MLLLRKKQKRVPSVEGGWGNESAEGNSNGMKGMTRNELLLGLAGDSDGNRSIGMG